MPDDLNDLIDTDEGNAPGGKAGSGGALRAQLEQVLEQNRLLNDRLQATEARERGRELEGLFTKHGVPPLAKDFFPSDGELSDEAVTGFVGKYGALWGVSADAAATPADQQQAAQRISNASSTAQPFQPNPGLLADAQTKLGEANTRDEVLQLFARMAAAQA